MRTCNNILSIPAAAGEMVVVYNFTVLSGRSTFTAAEITITSVKFRLPPICDDIPPCDSMELLPMMQPVQLESFRKIIYEEHTRLQLENSKLDSWEQEAKRNMIAECDYLLQRMNKAASPQLHEAHAVQLMGGSD